MATDTRPSVTVIGTISIDDIMQDYSIDLDDLPNIDLFHGDEVEVTIKRHTRTTGNLLEAKQAEESR